MDRLGTTGFEDPRQHAMAAAGMARPFAAIRTSHFLVSSTASVATANGTMNIHTAMGIGAVPKSALPHGV